MTDIQDMHLLPREEQTGHGRTTHTHTNTLSLRTTSTCLNTAQYFSHAHETILRPKVSSLNKSV